jgi:hypothetical protein
MKDFDTELLKLRQMRAELDKELAAEEAQRSFQETRWLTLVAGLVAVLTYFSQRVSISLSSVHLSKTQVGATLFGLAFAVALATFLVKAHKSTTGIIGYLKIEKILLINEMPNIFQIVSLLGFLNVFLKEFWIKVIATLILTTLLLIYLKSKREEMLTNSPKLKEQTKGGVLPLLNLVVGGVISFTIYALSSLVAAQFS